LYPPDSRVRYFEPRRFRRGIVYIKKLPSDIESLPRALERTRKHRHRIRITGKLATSREQAKRFLRSVISHNHTLDRPSHSADPSDPREIAERRESLTGTDTGPPTTSIDNMRAGIRGSIGGPVSGMVSRPSLADAARHGDSDVSLSSGLATHIMPGTDPHDKPLASGSGVQVSINLAEPVLFLQGFDQSDTSHGNTAMLRGTLHLRVTKSAKIKAVTLKFKGRATTKWPEGMA